jgi:peroxiredoxin
MLEHFWGKRKSAQPDVGEPAPDFALTTLGGGSFALSEELRNGPVVIAFFKITCSTCQFTFPFLERMYRAYQHKLVSFWGISQDDEEKSRIFCERFGVTFPIALDDASFSASKKYHFTNVPTFLLIDREGKVRFRQCGFSRAGLIQLSEEIGRLLERPPAMVFLASEMVPELKPG